jgi:hypothetical protein
VARGQAVEPDRERRAIDGQVLDVDVLPAWALPSIVPGPVMATLVWLKA